MKEHGIDPRRVFIAGLSAGGAMAAIVADAYPEIFAAVGVHSGLPNGAASNVAEALAVMNSGHSGNSRHGKLPSQPPQPPQQAHRLVPTIVFHGDQDRTVHPRNGEQVIASALGSAAAASPRVAQGVSAHGKSYTSSTHHGDTGKVLAEHWLVHGAGHAWSGGHAKGSYTDAKGPDATAEMLRFFFAHPHTA
jgi:poly(3-hydroxybutyrate) depolymerase